MLVDLAKGVVIVATCSLLGLGIATTMVDPGDADRPWDRLALDPGEARPTSIRPAEPHETGDAPGASLHTVPVATVAVTTTTGAAPAPTPTHDAVEPARAASGPATDVDEAPAAIDGPAVDDRPAEPDVGATPPIEAPLPPETSAPSPSSAPSSPGPQRGPTPPPDATPGSAAVA